MSIFNSISDYDFRNENESTFINSDAIRFISNLNNVAKKTGWLFSIDACKGKITMHFKANETYSFKCNSISPDIYNFEDNKFIADLIIQKTSSFRIEDYVLKKEKSKILKDNKPVTEKDIRKYYSEANEINQKIKKLINDVSNMETLCFSDKELSLEKNLAQDILNSKLNIFENKLIQKYLNDKTAIAMDSKNDYFEKLRKIITEQAEKNNIPYKKYVFNKTSNRNTENINEERERK